jgi:hypothetical protein
MGALFQDRPADWSSVVTEDSESVELSWMSQRTAEISRCELLLLETGSWGRGQFGNPEEGERPLLEASAEQRLMKT